MAEPELPGAPPGQLPNPLPGPVPRAPERPRRPDPAALDRRTRADSTGVRMVLGLAGLASASAITTVLLPSILPQTTVVAAAGSGSAAGGPTQPSVIHVTHVVTLAPGQTLPPDAILNTAPGSAPQATPQPTPRIVYQVVTRQSGKP